MLAYDTVLISATVNLFYDPSVNVPIRLDSLQAVPLSHYSKQFIDYFGIGAVTASLVMYPPPPPPSQASETYLLLAYVLPVGVMAILTVAGLAWCFWQRRRLKVHVDGSKDEKQKISIAPAVKVKQRTIRELLSAVWLMWCSWQQRRLKVNVEDGKSKKKKILIVPEIKQKTLAEMSKEFDAGSFLSAITPSPGSTPTHTNSSRDSGLTNSSSSPDSSLTHMISASSSLTNTLFKHGSGVSVEVDPTPMDTAIKDLRRILDCGSFNTTTSMGSASGIETDMFCPDKALMDLRKEFDCGSFRTMTSTDSMISTDDLVQEAHLTYSQHVVSPLTQDLMEETFALWYPHENAAAAPSLPMSASFSLLQAQAALEPSSQLLPPQTPLLQSPEGSAEQSQVLLQLQEVTQPYEDMRVLEDSTALPSPGAPERGLSERRLSALHTPQRTLSAQSLPQRPLSAKPSAQIPLSTLQSPKRPLSALQSSRQQSPRGVQQKMHFPVDSHGAIMATPDLVFEANESKGMFQMMVPRADSKLDVMGVPSLDPDLVEEISLNKVTTDELVLEDM